MHDRLGQAGGARGIQHPQGMVERHLLELEHGTTVLALAALSAGAAPQLQQLAPAHAPGQTRRARLGRQVRAAAPCGARSAARRGSRPVARAVVVAAAVPVAVHRQQHRRLDLREPIDHAARAELRRRARPDRADRGDGQQRDERLGDVRHVGDDAIAAPTPNARRPAATSATWARQLRPCQRVQLAQLRGVHDRDASGSRLAHQHVLGVVQLGALKPARARASDAGRSGICLRSPIGKHLLVGTGGAHAAVLPHRRPELLDLGHRPLPQLTVVGERVAGALTGPAHEPGHLRTLAVLRGRFPQRLGARVGSHCAHPSSPQYACTETVAGLPPPAHRVVLLAIDTRFLPTRECRSPRLFDHPGRGAVAGMLARRDLVTICATSSPCCANSRI